MVRTLLRDILLRVAFCDSNALLACILRSAYKDKYIFNCYFNSSILPHKSSHKLNIFVFLRVADLSKEPLMHGQ